MLRYVNIIKNENENQYHLIGGLKMRKYVFILFVLSVSLLFGCSKGMKNDSTLKEKENKVTVVLPKSPASIPVIRMIETKALGSDVNVDLKLYSDMEKMMVLATKNEYSYIGVPVHTAVTLNNKGLDVKLLNVMLWGGMCLSTTDPNCNTWKDLKGKQLFVPAKGSVPDIMTQYFLKKLGNITGDDMKIVYSNHANIAQFIKSSKAHYAIDAEPFVTFNKKNVKNYRIISDFNDAFKKTQGNEYSMPNFGIVVNGEFSNKNKEQVKKFNEELKKAIQWTVDNPNKAGALAKKYLNANGELIKEAMPNLNFVYKNSIESKECIEQYCKLLSSFKPESIGGKIPDEEFYYKNE